MQHLVTISDLLKLMYVGVCQAQNEYIFQTFQSHCSVSKFKFQVRLSLAGDDVPSSKTRYDSVERGEPWQRRLRLG